MRVTDFAAEGYTVPQPTVLYVGGVLRPLLLGLLWVPQAGGDTRRVMVVWLSTALLAVGQRMTGRRGASMPIAGLLKLPVPVRVPLRQLTEHFPSQVGLSLVWYSLSSGRVGHEEKARFLALVLLWPSWLRVGTLLGAANV